MAREPDMQFFRESGVWHRPEGAVRAEVMIKGGDEGSAVGEDGSIIPGQEGQVVIKEMSADESGETAQITIGEGGFGGSRGDLKAPGGHAGYAVVVTYFD